MEEEDTTWEDMMNLPAEPPIMRELCLSCRRPPPVCWCKYIPQQRLSPKSRVIILQHPSEEKRSLHTAAILSLSLASDKCFVYKGTKFPNSNKHGGLRQMLESPGAILLYPSREARDISELPPCGDIPYTLVIIDGTWPQAKSIYNRCQFLQSMKQVKITQRKGSEFLIRTQPAQGCLSTLEIAAEALSLLEGRPDYSHRLLKPLAALCSYQLDHGAVTHQSKEFLIQNDLYPKLVGKRLKKLLAKTDDS